MRVLLLIITFGLCLLIDNKPENSLSCREVHQQDSTNVIEIDTESLLFNLRPFVK